MTAAVELAQVWVPLMPEASKLAQGVDRIAADAEKKFGRSGKVMGASVARSFDTASRKAVESLRAVERQTIAVEKAKKAQADAEGRVLVATRKSEEVYARARSTNAQKTAASEAYSRAKRAEELTTNNLTRATKGLEAAQKQQTAAQNAAKNAMRGGSGALKMPMGAGLLAQAESYGADTGTRFVAGVKRVMGATAALAIGGGFAASLKSVVDAGLTYEKSMNTLSGVTKASTAEMAAARAEARALGADTTIVGASASDAGQAMTELAKGGLTLQQSMAATRGTLQLAAAAEVDAKTAATIQANALNTFKLGADQAGNVADYLANTANGASGEITDFALGLQQAGGVANGFGLSIEDTLSALGMLAKAGIKGSDAGTLLKTSLQSITDQGNPAQGAIAALGLTLYDSQQKFVGYRSMLEQVGEARKRMSEQDFQAQTNILFGSDAMRGAMVGNIEDYDKMKAAVTQYGGAAQMAQANMQGLPGVVEKISNTAEGAKLALFDLIDPTLQAGGEKVVGFLQKAADGFDKLRQGGGGEGMQQLRDGWRDISGAAERLAPPLTAAVKALATGAGTTAVATWRALGVAMKIVEPPLSLIANILGSNQGLTTGMVAVVAALYAKSKLLPPVLTAAEKATGAWTRAFGGWRTAADAAARTTDGITSSSTAYRGWATQVRDSYRSAADSATRFHRTAGVASGGMNLLKQAGGGVMGMLGGPWGLAATGLIGAMGLIGAAHANAAEEARKQKDAEDALKGTLVAGRITEQTQAGISENLETSGAAARAQSFGLDPNALLRSATGDQAARQQLLDLVRTNVEKAGSTQGSTVNEMLATLGKAGVNSEELSKALSKEGFNWDNVRNKINAYNAEQKKLNADYKPQIDSLNQLISALPDYAESAVTMNQAVNQQALTATQAAESWKRQNLVMNGTWETTERGVEAFGALGAQILSVPNQKQVVVKVPDDQFLVFKGKMEEAGNIVERLPNGEIVLTANTEAAMERYKSYAHQVESTPVQVPVEFVNSTGQRQLQVPLPAGTAPRVPSGAERQGWLPPRPPGGAMGGRVGNIIRGPGTGTSDSILAQTNTGDFLRVANTESINTAASTRANWPVIDAMNRGTNLSRWFKALPTRAGGGMVGLEDAVDQMIGTQYVRGGYSPSGADCTGGMSYLVNGALGRPNDSRMATGSAEEWLTAAGFQMGAGPAGTFRLGWKNGGPGGGHMAGTLPDGRNVEQGGSVGDFTVGGGVGANDGQFTNQAYLPLEALYPDGMPDGSASGGYGPMGGGGGGYGGGGSGGGGGMSASDQRSLRDAGQKVDDKNAAVAKAQQAVDEAKTDKERAAATERLTKAQRESKDAQDDLAAKQEEVNAKGADTGKQNGGDDGAKGFGQNLVSGALEAFGLDGSVFSNPMEWGIFKTGAGIANYLGGIAKNWKQPGQGQQLGQNPMGAEHGLGGSPGPGNFGDGGDGGFAGDMGLGMLQSILPNVGDFLPNATSGGGTVNSTTTNNRTSNSHNQDNRMTFTGPVRFDSPQGAPDRVRTRSSGLPRQS